MVLYFTPIGAEAGKDDWKIYMGRDKYENEDLIKYGLPHDVWWAFFPIIQASVNELPFRAQFCILRSGLSALRDAYCVWQRPRTPKWIASRSRFFPLTNEFICFEVDLIARKNYCIWSFIAIKLIHFAWYIDLHVLHWSKVSCATLQLWKRIWELHRESGQLLSAWVSFISWWPPRTFYYQIMFSFHEFSCLPLALKSGISSSVQNAMCPAF